jgi:hypothetical protein
MLLSNQLPTRGLCVIDSALIIPSETPQSMESLGREVVLGLCLLTPKVREETFNLCQMWNDVEEKNRHGLDWVVLGTYCEVLPPLETILAAASEDVAS